MAEGCGGGVVCSGGFGPLAPVGSGVVVRQAVAATKQLLAQAAIAVLGAVAAPVL